MILIPSISLKPIILITSKIMKLSILFLLALGLCSIANATQKHNIMLVFKQSNIDRLEEIVNDISDYKSPNYGKYLAREEILDIIKPSLEELAPVYQWLKSHGIRRDQIQDFGDMWQISLDPYTIQNMINITIESIPKSKMLKADKQYTLPRELGHIIDFVGNIYFKDNYKQVKRSLKAKNGFNVDPGYTGREVGCRLYSMNCSHNVSGVSAGAIEYQDNAGFTLGDLCDSQKSNGEVCKNVSHIVGTNSGIDPESELDVQMITQTASNVDLWFWDVQGWVYEFAVNFFNTENVPDVISMSWGWAEDKQCSITSCGNMTSEDYVRRVNNEYLKLVARGITICVSAGDAGAPGRTSEMCDSSRPVNAVFPGSSPWVVSVGATFVEANDNHVNWTTPLCQNHTCASGLREHTTNFEYTQWTAGGGFSKYTTRIRPYWQEQAVQKYLNSGVPLPSQFARHGRAYPDVTAFGHNCPTWMSGMLSGVDGTSCSSPVIAGIIAVLNDHLVSKGKSKVGYVNPLLYQMHKDDPSTFNDLNTGNNWCTEAQCCPTRNDGGSNFGYMGTWGYDPVTGLGTPNVERMKAWLDRNL